jgi:hypothetical protein
VNKYIQEVFIFGPERTLKSMAQKACNPKNRAVGWVAAFPGVQFREGIS